MYQETTTPMLEKIPAKKCLQIAAVTSVSLGTFCAGTALCWTSPALPHILEPNPSPGFTVTPKDGALIASMLTIGALTSAIPTGYLSDKFGRKPVILWLAMMFLINWILIIFAKSYLIVIIARFLAGIGLGGICVVAPIYVAEISEASSRGFYGSFLQLGLAGGVFFTCLIGSFTNWILLNTIMAATPIILGITFILMPESPIYLLSKNNRKLAEKNLRKLRGNFYDISEEISNAENTLIKSNKKSISRFELLNNRGNIRAIIAVVGSLMFQQFSGINAIVFYTVTIFKESGSDISPFVAAVIVNSVQLIGSIIPMLLIERANRKLFLFVSSIGMSICLTLLAIYFHSKSIKVDYNLSFIPLTSTILYMVFFCVGFGPIPWMLLGELYSPEIKGFASGLSILINWLSAFVVTFSFPLINHAFGSYVSFYILGVVMGLATLFVYFLVPETRGKTLSEIQEELNR